jgi:hypothetical protein
MAAGPAIRYGACAIAVAVCVGLPLTGCLVDDGRPPIARIDIVPGSIPEHDDFQTAVTLDGSTSADPVDDPDGSERLDFHWEILGDEVRFDDGSDESEVMPVVRFRGEVPATVLLTVTDPDGLDSSAQAHVQLSVR